MDLDASNAIEVSHDHSRITWARLRTRQGLEENECMDEVCYGYSIQSKLNIEKGRSRGPSPGREAAQHLPQDLSIRKAGLVQKSEVQELVL